jgi:hypothetical protein
MNEARSMYDEAMTPTVPRVAHSLDDLRAGMWVACWCRDYGTDIEEGGETWHWSAFPIDEGQLKANWSAQDWSKVVILSEPPPELVTVSRERIDNLERALSHYSGDGQDVGYGLQVAARALVNEVRSADA